MFEFKGIKEWICLSLLKRVSLVYLTPISLLLIKCFHNIEIGKSSHFNYIFMTFILIVVMTLYVTQILPCVYRYICPTINSEIRNIRHVKRLMKNN